MYWMFFIVLNRRAMSKHPVKKALSSIAFNSSE